MVAAINDTPHDNDCAYLYAPNDPPSPCDCWKAKTLAGVKP